MVSFSCEVSGMLSTGAYLHPMAMRMLNMNANPRSRPVVMFLLRKSLTLTAANVAALPSPALIVWCTSMEPSTERIRYVGVLSLNLRGDDGLGSHIDLTQGRHC
jgi:hypothetical protein